MCGAMRWGSGGGRRTEGAPDLLSANGVVDSGGAGGAGGAGKGHSGLSKKKQKQEQTGQEGGGGADGDGGGDGCGDGGGDGGGDGCSLALSMEAFVYPNPTAMARSPLLLERLGTGARGAAGAQGPSKTKLWCGWRGRRGPVVGPVWPGPRR
jgi:hypothetical protein